MAEHHDLIDPLDTIDVLARAQYGLVTRAQLAAAGLDRGRIDRALRRHQLVIVHRGVFRVAGAPLIPELHLLAACLAGGPTALASHAAAAWQWDCAAVGGLVPEITVENPRQSIAGVTAHRRLASALDGPHDHLIRRGIPVTSPLRTVVELGAVAPPAVVSEVLDDLVGRKLVTISGVQSTLARLGGRGRRGAGTLRAVLDGRGLGPTDHDGALEPMFAELCRRNGLPIPTPQFTIRLGGRTRRLDFAYVPARIAIEVDGYERHSRFDVFNDDRLRGNELELDGWLVLRFTWHQLVHRPDLVADTVRRAWRTRSPDTVPTARSL
jgi:hypothetical protein